MPPALAEMMIPLSTPGLLFPAVSLLFLSYTNRFLALSGLVRSLYGQWEERGSEDKILMAQIRNLSRRLTLIRLMQVSGAFSLLFAVASMVAILFKSDIGGLTLFVASLAAMGISLVTLIWECFVSGGALRIMLDSTDRRI